MSTNHPIISMRYVNANHSVNVVAIPGPFPEGQKALMLVHFLEECRTMEDFVARREFFAELVVDEGYTHIYHTKDMSNDGWEQSVYCLESKTLTVTCQSHNALMPESAWRVDENRVERQVIEDNIVKKKVWERYVDAVGLKRVKDLAKNSMWMVVYTDHRRDPLCMREGRIPVVGLNFARELKALLSGVNDPALWRTLRAWRPKKAFDLADVTEIKAALPTIRALSQADLQAQLRDGIKELAVLLDRLSDLKAGPSFTTLYGFTKTLHGGPNKLPQTELASANPARLDLSKTGMLDKKKFFGSMPPILLPDQDSAANPEQED